MAELFVVPQGKFYLSRYPKRKNELLRAWDAADEYLCNHIAESQLACDSSRLLILNDSFGALSVALNRTAPTMMTDSFLAQKGALENYAANDLDSNTLNVLPSTDELTGIYDIVLIKIPKSHALLEDQLRKLRPHITQNTTLIAAGMVKHLHASLGKLFEKVIGPTHASLAKKKARLIFSKYEEGLTVGDNPFPKRYQLEGTSYQITNHSGVFSRDSLDIGTRFFLQNLPSIESEGRIVDLGCGNGVVGLMMSINSPNSELIFTDESFMAIASAKENFKSVHGKELRAQFMVTNCLQGVGQGSVDLILNNPPFHQQNVVSDSIAKQMFLESKHVLKERGELWVIGNRHLGYHVALKELFGNCTVVAKNDKFVILTSIKR